MELKLSNLKRPPGSKKKPKIVGRGIGSGHGKTSCRGQKGQRARSGRWSRSFEGGQTPLHRRLPKKGFGGSINKIHYQILNLSQINKKFKDKDFPKIDKEILIKSGLIKKRSLPVKLLGDGDIEFTIKIEVDKASKQAIKKVKDRGGEVVTSQAK